MSTVQQAQAKQAQAKNNPNGCQAVFKQPIKNLPSSHKPREKLQAIGAKNLTEAELLAILLRSGTQQHSAIELAAMILDKYPLAKLTERSAADLQAFAGIGPAKAVTLLACFELAQRLNKPGQAISLNSPQKVFYQSFSIKDKKQEHCLALYLNGSKQLLKKKTVAIGTFNKNFLEFRELLAPAITLPAAGIVLAHNHPSGDIRPSQADIKVTKQILKGVNLIGIELIDHVIVSQDKYFSFRQAGLMD